jgi:hypothetical protein
MIAQKIEANRARHATTSRETLIANANAAWDQEDAEILTEIQSGNASPAFIALYGPQVGIFPDTTPEPPAAHTKALNASQGFTKDNLNAMVDVRPSYDLPRETEIMHAALTLLTEDAIVRYIDDATANVYADLSNLHRLAPRYVNERKQEIVTANPIDGQIDAWTIVALVMRVARHRATRSFNPVNDPYANLPSVGGGAHTAAELSPNRATTQKRDNDRAERARITDAYHHNATTQAQAVATLLGDLGFVIVEQHECDDVPVTTWYDDDDKCTIKQTPYTIKVYNGRPSYVRGKGDAKLVNRVDHGWVIEHTDNASYSAGVAAALLPLLETPDPLMSAIDAMEQGEHPICQHCGNVCTDVIAPIGSTDWFCTPKCGLTAIKTIAECKPALILNGGQPAMSGPWSDTTTPDSECRRCCKTRTLNTDGYCEKCQAEFDSYGPATFAAIMAPDYHIDVPAISGGSDEPDICSNCRKPFSGGSLCDLCPDCAELDTLDGPTDETACGAACRQSINDGWAKLDTLFIAHETARDEQEYHAIKSEQNRTVWASLEAQANALNIARKQPVIMCDECNTYPAFQQGLCRHCFDTHPGNCLTCGQPATGYICGNGRDLLAVCDDHKQDKCPGFYSSQAGAVLRCDESKTVSAEYCDGCTRAIKREEQHEMNMAHLDQWGHA